LSPLPMRYSGWVGVFAARVGVAGAATTAAVREAGAGAAAGAPVEAGPVGAGAVGAGPVEAGVVGPGGADGGAWAEAREPASVRPAATMSRRQRDMGSHSAKLVPLHA